MSESLGLWSHYRDRSTIKEAVKDCFPKTLESNPNLKLAVAQIEVAEAAIDSIMSNLEEEAIDNDVNWQE